MEHKRTLLVMAAGMASRYGGNKQIDKVGPHGEILLDYSVYDALRAGFTKIVFVIKQDMYNTFRALCGSAIERYMEVAYSFQDYSSLPPSFIPPTGRVKPYGTVHAVLCARGAVNGPFAVINADDYYGRDAFRVIASPLEALQGKNALMVSYALKNTLSENGTVTRGICERDADGCLRKITETYHIRRTEDGLIRDIREEGESPVLSPEVPVSMNMWGFSTDFFPLAERDFRLFLENTQADPLKKEFVLPAAVDSWMHSDGLKVRMIPTNASWFGMTYHEDRETVAQRLAQLHREGVYPDSLFP